SRHYYSTSPEYAGQEVLVAIRAHSIDILDDHKRLVVRHSRVYGERRSDSCDYRTSLAVLMNNPGAWKNSGIPGTDSRSFEISHGPTATHAAARDAEDYAHAFKRIRL
ncbi:Mu transposase domain-containing protein, partial [Geotalea toluenoxydans]|uniref:Mu transposase domain-containing protein n=1 Tax=Geotalea toluenoxydans TaxID=421624 RepID=UPI003F71C7E9